ncbi:sce7725 family protein [Rummeliibacillus pycnus]|uniref:sce7725 family protein n=1 Tax=Rummeliibacillus pycnus TaxID=101070 RepID=UPI0037C70EA7
MYFPYLRGGQYDLIALRELLQNDLLNENIIPIVEPTKLSSTLESTVRTFTENNQQMILISNPTVGVLRNQLQDEATISQFYHLFQEEEITIGHILNEESRTQIPELIRMTGAGLEDLVIIHRDLNLLPIYNEIFNGGLPKLNLLPIGRDFKRHLSLSACAILEDKFHKLSRNADYLENDIEFFSEEHLFYRQEGYVGFADYSIIGEDYIEGGFAPYAVAFHLVFPIEGNKLNVAHFVSDSNDDIDDPAGKFAEALSKFIVWYEGYSDDERINTFAIRRLLQHNDEGTFPGLPTLKKLTIMHHLELMANIIEIENLKV